MKSALRLARSASQRWAFAKPFAKDATEMGRVAESLICEN